MMLQKEEIINRVVELLSEAGDRELEIVYAFVLSLLQE